MQMWLCKKSAKKKKFSQNKENPDINCSQNTKEKVNKQVIKLFLETYFKEKVANKRSRIDVAEMFVQ